MKNYKLLTVAVLFAVLISGCVASSKKPVPHETNLARQHIAKGETLERENRFSSALEQYKLALTIEPENKEAHRHKIKVLSLLWEKAQHHYRTGLQFDKQGKHEAARKEYLSALQNWPEYKEAKERLTPSGVVDEATDYIVHTLLYGESVSQLSMIYYGDFKKYSVIGKFNVLTDVTKVRVGEKLKIPVIEGIPLLTLQQKQKDYLNLQATRGSAANDKPEEEIKTQTIEASTAPETIVQPDEEIPEPEQDPAEETVQEVMSSSEDTVQELIPTVDESVEEVLSTSDERLEEIIPTPEETVEEIIPTTPEETVQVAIVPSEDTTHEIIPPPSEEEVPNHYALGTKLFDKKKYPAAIPLFLAAAELDPDNETLIDYLFESHFQQALILFNSKDYLAAKDNFESALKYNANCEKCQDYIEKSVATYKEKHYNKGIHYFGKELLDKAIKEWKLVKEIDPDYKKVTPNLRKAQMLFKRLESIKQSTVE
jgi:tetratricopeptide (TPR) repeat protein